MWRPPSLPRRKIVALRHVIHFLNAGGLFALPPSDGRWVLLYELLFGAYFLSVAFSLVVLAVFAVVDLALRFDNVDVLADRILIIAGLIYTLVKRYSLVGNRRRVETLVDGLQRRRFVKNDRASSRNVKILTVIWGLTTVAFFLPFHFQNPGLLELPSANAHFLGIKSDDLLYAIVYAWNTIALSIVILNLLGVDLFIVGTYGEAACRLEALGEILENVCSTDTFNDEGFDRSSFRLGIEKAVVEHCDVMKSIKELNHIFHWSLVFQSIFTAGIISGCSFHGFVNILNGNFLNFVKSLMYASIITCETWFYCNSGDRVKRASLNVAEALWQSRWYELPAKERRSVLLIMMASGKSLNMSAGQIFRMDFKSMGIVLSSAFSYFTVLRNIYKLQVDNK